MIEHYWEGVRDLDYTTSWPLLSTDTQKLTLMVELLCTHCMATQILVLAEYLITTVGWLWFPC